MRVVVLCQELAYVKGWRYVPRSDERQHGYKFVGLNQYRGYTTVVGADNPIDAVERLKPIKDVAAML